MELIEVRHLDNLISETRAGNLSLGAAAHTQVVGALAEALGENALLVRIPEGLDAVSFVPLVIAQQCDRETLEATASALAAGKRRGSWQDLLEAGVRGRFLLVDRLDRLRASGTRWDLNAVHADDVRTLHDWLRRHAAATTGTGTRAPGVEPRESARWDTSFLWASVAQDPDRYSLAVGRALLRGASDAAGRGWDEASLIADLLDDMPSSHRDLVLLLVAHGRPVARRVFERMGLATREVIDGAHALALIEVRRDELSLPKPWYSNIAIFDSRAAHRRLADAFARFSLDVSESGHALAVLEAHRHYAAIPDAERALSFATYGSSALLESAVQQSKAGRRAEAAHIYEALLELDHRLSGEQEGLGPRVRGYVTHYLHYNRAMEHAEPLTDTISGYREALVDWPENALFWQRLVRSLFNAEDEDTAMAALREAYGRVPRHSERDRTLVVRTVDRLMSDGLWLPALFVWNDHVPLNDVDREVERQLVSRLKSGWETTRLWADGVPAITLGALTRLQAIAPSAAGEPWRCAAGAHVRPGRTRCEAVRAAVRAAVLNELADRWRLCTGGLSVVAERRKHPAWHAILRMGREVVPEILRRIEQQPDHFHAALVELTGENPVPAGAKLTVSGVCARWVTWGRERGLVQD